MLYDRERRRFRAISTSSGIQIHRIFKALAHSEALSRLTPYHHCLQVDDPSYLRADGGVRNERISASIHLLCRAAHARSLSAESS